MARPKKEVVEEKEEVLDPFSEILRIMQGEQHKDTNYGFYSGAELNTLLKDLSEEVVTTGSARLDVLMGGGFRPGMTVFFGDYESGKTAQALVWGKNWQDKYKEKARVFFFDAEGRLTKYKIQQSGIDTERFGLYRGNFGETIFDSIEKIINNNPNEFRIFFIIDSINAIVSKKEVMEKDLTSDAKIASAAALTSRAFSRLGGPLRYNGHHLYLTSQMRSQNITGGHEAPKPSGGKATGFFGDVIGRLHKGWTKTHIKDGSGENAKVIGNKTSLTFLKSYNETTHEEIDIPIKFKHIGGLWKEYECLMVAMEWGWIKKSGAWFEWSEIFKKFATDDKLFEGNEALKDELDEKIQGEVNTVQFITEHPDLVKYIEAKYKQLALS